MYRYFTITETMKNKSIVKSAFIALFAALIAVGAFIRIPVGVVPVILQNVLCLLTGSLLGGFMGSLPAALFLVTGLVGFPVYSGGTGGFASWMGPTGGFLLGFFLGALTTSLIAGKPTPEEKLTWKTVLRISLAFVAGMMVLYVPGIAWFSYWAVQGGSVPEGSSVIKYAMTACVIPFIPGDIAKIIVSIPIALKVRPIVALYLGRQ